MTLACIWRALIVVCSKCPTGSFSIVCTRSSELNAVSVVVFRFSLGGSFWNSSYAVCHTHCQYMIHQTRSLVLPKCMHSQASTLLGAVFEQVNDASSYIQLISHSYTCTHNSAAVQGECTYFICFAQIGNNVAHSLQVHLPTSHHRSRSHKVARSKSLQFIKDCS